MKKHKWYNEIIAFAEGKEIEVRYNNEGASWVPASTPQFWNPRYEFRVKTKSKYVSIPFEDWEEYQRMKNQSEERDFVKGRDYVHSLGAIMIDIKSNNPSIENGFSSIEGGFCRLNVYNRKDWREATEEEVIEAFENECVRKLGADWREVKLKTHSSGERIGLNIGNLVPIIDKCDYNGWIVWNKNGCVYYDGKWAKKLIEI